MVYFENLSFLSLVIGLVKTRNLFKSFMRNDVDIFYIDATLFSQFAVIPLFRFCGARIRQLHFRLLDIVDETGELVRLRITRSDLLEIQNKILESEAYKAIYHDSWQQERLKEFISKSIIDGHIRNVDSVSRFLLLTEVVAWHMRSSGISESVFMVRNRPWFGIYEDYAAKYKINLLSIKYGQGYIIKKSYFYETLLKFPLLYRIFRNIKHGYVFDSWNKEINPIPKVYIEGRGDVNLENNGDHSDFFWQLNSDFPKINILYKHHSRFEKEYLEGHGVHTAPEGCELNSIYQSVCKSVYKKPQLTRDFRFRDEINTIEPILNSYDYERYNWGSFFHVHKVKVYFTWFKYDSSHMVVADAIKENGGISAVWQMALDGYENAECKIGADIVFTHSDFSNQIEERLGSKVKYNIITGYPKDYVGSLVKKRALSLRETLQTNGAEKIIFAIDENSGADERWHTGHGLQRENYSFVLEKVLDTPWLGVVFKPKNAQTLRARLGGVAELLERAEKTGRCFIYEDSGRHTTSAPPILAGLSADVCIHGHLSSGTAALECVLEGLPTLLIDREGCPNSKLYELPEGKVIFKSWPETIDAIMEHFQTPGGVPGFGDWSPILDELDPFRDGKAAYRIGTYLHWLIQGFEKGMKREEIMAEAAEKYRKQWGADKVLSA